MTKVHDQYLLFSTTFGDAITEELTDAPTEPIDAEEWDQKVANGLTSLPEPWRSSAARWLTGTATKSAETFLKWLSDPKTVEASVEL